MDVDRNIFDRYDKILFLYIEPFSQDQCLFYYDKKKYQGGNQDS